MLRCHLMSLLQVCEFNYCETLANTEVVVWPLNLSDRLLLNGTEKPNQTKHIREGMLKERITLDYESEPLYCSVLINGCHSASWLS